MVSLADSHFGGEVGAVDLDERLWEVIGKIHDDLFRGSFLFCFLVTACVPRVLALCFSFLLIFYKVIDFVTWGLLIFRGRKTVTSPRRAATVGSIVASTPASLGT